MMLPTLVREAMERSETASFEMSCEPVVGELLQWLSQTAPQSGRILELGTGVGVGLAWLVSGLRERSDVEIVTVELDSGNQALARESTWPEFVRFESGDGAVLVESLGQFDLIFADAPGGKLDNLEGTIRALRPSGVLIVDDMDLSRHSDPKLRKQLTRVREKLLRHPELAVIEVAAGSGVVLASRRGERT